MKVDLQTLSKIRNFGALKYAPEKIVTLLALTGDEKTEFLLEINNPQSQIYTYYHQGWEIGEYNIDAELAKKAETGDIMSIIQLNERQGNRRIDDLKKKLFGI